MEYVMILRIYVTRSQELPVIGHKPMIESQMKAKNSIST